MDVHVDATRNDLATGRIDDLRAIAGRRGQPRAYGRNRLTADRDVFPRFSVGAEEKSIGYYQIVVHGDAFLFFRNVQCEARTGRNPVDLPFAIASARAPLPSAGRKTRS
jgi:hypothetical protein